MGLMPSYLYPGHFDLVTPDGKIVEFSRLTSTTATVVLRIEDISPAFVGYDIDLEDVHFNLKSTLAQLGLHGVSEGIYLDSKSQHAEVKVKLMAIGSLGELMLNHLHSGAYIGKLFAADPRRRVRNPDYLARMFGRSDRQGRPLLSLGGMHGSEDLVLEKIGGRTVAYLALQEGRADYGSSIKGFIPTIAKALSAGYPMRELLRLHQVWKPNLPRQVQEGEILLVRTLPLHVRTVFAQVVSSLLPQGLHHTSANILQPDTEASGDVYEFFGNADSEITDVPLEFYTLEPHREHVFFKDRDQLQSCLEDQVSVFEAFETAPQPYDKQAAIFVVKGEQLLKLEEEDWISSKPLMQDFPGVFHGTRQALLVDRFIYQQPAYPFLQAIEDGLITSQGILLTRYFPTPMMKKVLLGGSIQYSLKAIYFETPSNSYGDFFSHEDRSFLADLAKFGIPVYWVDKATRKILQYVQKPGKDSGMFIPLNAIETFLKATVFGVYGSNLLEGEFESELTKLLGGVLKLRERMTHPLLNTETPLALVTGGGPGAMEVGNRVAQSLDILSCANIVDFGTRGKTITNEQMQNPYVEAKMTYRLDKLVERQAEFDLDFPIFLMGGIGTDFEYALEEVKRKVGSSALNPIILFGSPEYWREKVSHRFRCNLENKTIKGSEWISNCFYCVRSAQDALQVLEAFFEGSLPIGPDGPVFEDGFVVVDNAKLKTQN